MRFSRRVLILWVACNHFAFERRDWIVTEKLGRILNELGGSRLIVIGQDGGLVIPRYFRDAYSFPTLLCACRPDVDVDYIGGNRGGQKELNPRLV